MNRRRRGLPPREDIDFQKIQPDPSHIGGVAQAPYVRLPDGTLFASRARRLRNIAGGHPMGPFLNFLGDVVSAQAQAADLPPPAAVPAELLHQRRTHAMPLLTADEVRDDAGFAAVMTRLLEVLDPAQAPPLAQRAAQTVRAMSVGARDDLAADIMAGATPADQVAESLFIAAGLQVHLTRLATLLDPAEIQPVADSVCPVCGAAPVSSMVVGWTQASKARYCACSLCGTMWNHVRIKCTSCGATGGIIYHHIEGETDTIGIESCTTCQTYIKHLQQHADPQLDPLADDVASYTLDLLAREAGFSRSSINPLFVQAS